MKVSMLTVERTALCEGLTLLGEAEGAKEAQLQGPITFPQERLLSYFWNLLKNEGADDQAAAWDERAAQQQQSAEVFMLLRSLVSLRLLSQARHMPHVSVWLLDYALLGALLQQSDLAVMILVLDQYLASAVFRNPAGYSACSLPDIADAIPIVQASGDMLDDGKYQCNIKDELAQKLAHNLKIDLSIYLLYV